MTAASSASDSRWLTQIQKYKLQQLTGGVRVVNEELPSVRSISLGFWIGSGSRHEKASDSGISHFIEHLLFKGSARFSAGDIARIFDSFGADINAATAREYTVLHARFIDEHLAEAFEVMADMIVRPSFVEIDQEREVVIEEIAMYEDSPGELIADYLTQTIFGKHPLGKSVLGTAQIIGSVDQARLCGYHADHYTLPNIVVAAAGNVDIDQLSELTALHLDGAEGQLAVAQTQKSPPAPVEIDGASCFYEKDTQQYHVCFGGLGMPRGSEDKYALSILDSILGSTASSRLFQEVREKRGLAYSIYSYASFYADTGLVGVYFGCRGDSVATITGIVSEQIRLLMDDGIDEQELARAKESAKGKIVLSMETTHSRMSRLGKLTITDSEILSIDEIIEKISQVTAEDVTCLARRYYDPGRLTAVAIGPDVNVFGQALEKLSSGREPAVKVCGQGAGQ
jgi:predicted Zn-dependent peptidase